MPGFMMNRMFWLCESKEATGVTGWILHKIQMTREQCYRRSWIKDTCLEFSWLEMFTKVWSTKHIAGSSQWMWIWMSVELAGWLFRLSKYEPSSSGENSSPLPLSPLLVSLSSFLSSLLLFLVLCTFLDMWLLFFACLLVLPFLT